MFLSGVKIGISVRISHASPESLLCKEIAFERLGAVPNCPSVGRSLLCSCLLKETCVEKQISSAGKGLDMHRHG